MAGKKIATTALSIAALLLTLSTVKIAFAALPNLTVNTKDERGNSVTGFCAAERLGSSNRFFSRLIYSASWKFCKI